MALNCLRFLLLFLAVSLPTSLLAKKSLKQTTTVPVRNLNGDFNFGQDVEGSGGTINVDVRSPDTDDDDDDEDFDHFDFSGEEDKEEQGSGSIPRLDKPPPPVLSEKPCLKRLSEATSLGQTNGRVFGVDKTVFMPKCTYTGDYAAQQCHNDECWCADKDGNQIMGTVRRNPLSPDCSYIDRDVKTAATARPPPHYQPSTHSLPPPYEHHPHNTIHPHYNNIIQITEKDLQVIRDTSVDPNQCITSFDGNEKPKNGGRDGNVYHGNHDNSYHDDPTSQKMARAFINQPGILAAIIAGAVIGLLSAVLLVMFIIYHLRHSRDHADEKANKVPIIGYTNAHDRDLYA